MATIKNDPGHDTAPSNLVLAQSSSPGSSPTPDPSSTAAMPNSTLRAAPKGWNTDKLALRLGTDFISALCAGGLVAPMISVIDK